MNKFFKLSANKTTVPKEIVAGLTTFFTMAYIIFVNPNMLVMSGTPDNPMSWGGVFVATILAAAIGTLVMGIVANVPYAQAPGMGLNAFFTFVVCGSLGFQWQEALALVFICGIINIIITATKIRKSIIKAIPASLQNAIGGGIGIFIAYIGVKNAGFLSFTADPDTYVVTEFGVMISDASIVPALVDFTSLGAILALVGLIIMVVLVVLKVKGALFIGILATTLIALITGYVALPEGDLIDFKAIGAVQDTAFAFFGDIGFKSMFADSARIFTVIVTVFAFSLSDTFDTIGTFIGTGRASGIFDAEDEKALTDGKGFKSKMDRALFADATATSVGALLGTSNTTTYVESAAGIAAGGRTGLTSVVVAVLFLLCLPLSAIFGIVPAEATAPALIVVGVMMMASFVEIKWNEFEEAAPAFMTVIIMAFGYSISNGIAAGFIFYCIIMLCKGKIKKVHPILIVATLLFILNFVITAVTA